MTDSLFDDPFVGAAGLSVAELTALIAGTIDAVFPDDVWVIGEMSGLNRSRGGHVYFDLVEPVAVPGATPESRLPVVLFSTARRAVNDTLKRAGGVKMTDGMRVRIRAAIEFYPRSGRLQLRMTGIDPSYTLGALAAERDALLRRLRSGALFDRNRSLTLVAVPLRVGLVTSATSAAAADFLHELELSGYPWQVVLCDTAVQGAGAEHGIAAAITTLAQSGVDAVAVVRGGGSRGDLVAFDAEVVALAIAHAPVPVLTGIGHEIDRSVADEVAHTAAKTPTACAAVLVGRIDAFRREIDRRREHIVRACEHAVSRSADELVARAQLIRRTTTMALASSESRVRERASGVGTRAGRASARAERAIDGRVGELIDRTQRATARAERELGHRAARRAALDPARMLARGWSITTDDQGRLVRDPATVSSGDLLVTRVMHGTLISHAVSMTTATRDTHDADST